MSCFASAFSTIWSHARFHTHMNNWYTQPTSSSQYATNSIKAIQTTIDARIDIRNGIKNQLYKIFESIEIVSNVNVSVRSYSENQKLSRFNRSKQENNQLTKKDREKNTCLWFCGVLFNLFKLNTIDLKKRLFIMFCRPVQRQLRL